MAFATAILHFFSFSVVTFFEEAYELHNEINQNLDIICICHRSVPPYHILLSVHKVYNTETGLSIFCLYFFHFFEI